MRDELNQQHGFPHGGVLVVTSTRRIASCHAELFAGGKICAVAQGTVGAVELPAG